MSAPHRGWRLFHQVRRPQACALCGARSRSNYGQQGSPGRAADPTRSAPQAATAKPSGPTERPAAGPVVPLTGTRAAPEELLGGVVVAPTTDATVFRTITKCESSRGVGEPTISAGRAAPSMSSWGRLSRRRQMRRSRCRRQIREACPAPVGDGCLRSSNEPTEAGPAPAALTLQSRSFVFRILPVAAESLSGNIKRDFLAGKLGRRPQALPGIIVSLTVTRMVCPSSGSKSCLSYLALAKLSMWARCLLNVVKGSSVLVSRSGLKISRARIVTPQRMRSFVSFSCPERIRSRYRSPVAGLAEVRGAQRPRQ